MREESARLLDLRGAPVWISFSRFASCPLCNYEIHRVCGEWGVRFAEHRFRHFRFMQSPPEKIAEYVTTKDPPFDLVADPEMSVYRAFEVERSLRKMVSREAFRVGKEAAEAGFLPRGAPDGPLTRLPADFLIDCEGVIRCAYYGQNMADHVPLGEVSNFLAEYARPAAAP